MPVLLKFSVWSLEKSPFTCTFFHQASTLVWLPQLWQDFIIYNVNHSTVLPAVFPISTTLLFCQQNHSCKWSLMKYQMATLKICCHSWLDVAWNDSLDIIMKPFHTKGLLICRRLSLAGYTLWFEVNLWRSCPFYRNKSTLSAQCWWLGHLCVLCSVYLCGSINYCWIS